MVLHPASAASPSPDTTLPEASSKGDQENTS